MPNMTFGTVSSNYLGKNISILQARDSLNNNRECMLLLIIGAATPDDSETGTKQNAAKRLINLLSDLW